MQTKKWCKSLIIVLLALVMCLSPVLLTGCFSSISSGDGGSSSSGGDGSSSIGGGSGGENIEPEDYFENYKFAYRPSEDDKQDEFMLDIKRQTGEVAFDIIRNLYAEYGYKIDASEKSFMNKMVINIELQSDGTYKENNKALKYDEILGNGTNPLFTSTVSFVDSYGNTPQYCYYDYDKRGDAYADVIYDPTAEYAKYYSHENAINADVDSNEQIFAWKWNCNASEYEDYSLDIQKSYAFSNFVNNLVYRKKLELAILLITSGYDIRPTGANYDIYLTETAKIDTIASKYPSLSLYNKEDNVAFYQEVDEEIFEYYIKKIDHYGYTATETTSISTFICDEVIGTGLVSVDNTRYVNVAVVSNSSVEIATDSKYSNLGFLNDETFYSAYNINMEKTLNDCVCSGLFAPETYSDENLSRADIGILNSLSHLVFAYMYDIAEIMADSPLSEGRVYERISQTYVDYQEIFNKVCDLDGDGVFNTDFWDLDGDGSTEDTLHDNINVNNYHLDCLVFSARLAYFKNYVNTAYKIVKNVVSAEADETYKTNYKKLTGIDFQFDVKYPLIPATFTVDYTNDEVMFNEEGIGHLPSGYKHYQSMVFMPKKAITINEIILFIGQQNTTNATNFDVEVYARYFDADSNSFATWGDNNSTIYTVGTVTVEAKDDIVDSPIYVNIKEILTTAKIGETQKSAILPAYDHITQASKEATLITKSSSLAKFYEFVTLPNGKTVVGYNEQCLPDGERSSYLEFLFSSDAENFYQISFMPYDY